VLAKAATYRGTPRPGRLAVEPATVREVLANPRIMLTPLQRADLTAGGIDERLVATLAAIGRRHSVIITALQSDHYPGTNHEAGRAMDIGAVDTEICPRRPHRCVRAAPTRARRRTGAAALDRADLLLGSRRVDRPGWGRARRPL